jgi:hypothetical protein
MYLSIIPKTIFSLLFVLESSKKLYLFKDPKRLASKHDLYAAVFNLISLFEINNGI